MYIPRTYIYIARTHISRQGAIHMCPRYIYVSVITSLPSKYIQRGHIYTARTHIYSEYTYKQASCYTYVSSLYTFVSSLYIYVSYQQLGKQICTARTHICSKLLYICVLAVYICVHSVYMCQLTAAWQANMYSQDTYVQRGHICIARHIYIARTHMHSSVTSCFTAFLAC